ncbi:uncharacterized protein B0H18DRAFT_1118165 [Fomitopsis serialis]|uniref:uncharacterized protein n=1 Tax=Fomitopsis serialis TaxID=139415 RepID=UPI0020084C53|nr:uncharacterized protein B0H18DRAFT_1118165 [Neoantrodia serialis]KAH9928148.1 hypothetical protein B0H18DRAFT_1118165 [Neoantrodia serialis]
MFRALLAAPDLCHLFEYAILQPDPRDCGFLYITMQNSLQDCNGVVPAAGQSELPTRSATATSSLALSISPPPSRRSPRPPRTTTLLSTARSLCQWQPPAEALDVCPLDDVRRQHAGCPPVARSWASSGGTAYVGMYTVGASYPSNSDVSKCTDSGSICHQDDIEIVFGTAPSPTSAQSALIAEIHALLPVPQHGQRDFRLSSGLAERARVVPVLDRAQPTSRSYERLAWDHPSFSSTTPLAVAVSVSRFHLAEMKAERLELK